MALLVKPPQFRLRTPTVIQVLMIEDLHRFTANGPTRATLRGLVSRMSPEDSAIYFAEHRALEEQMHEDRQRREEHLADLRKSHPHLF